ncbi:lipase secretion chaperone [Vibrio rumoiensis]|uniref:Lipase chaperone n=1 Tax=Vibrio rumoiensis 1S-45 TaxID=1188252 RepID=A0A1E5E1N6_9VIBR|nr:lipase secretion chaperone [Vibrio rumoiensis]OEF24242.1 hypothetical protein A1QC_10520 [Vibrio rumoiensis 1S-45]
MPFNLSRAIPAVAFISLVSLMIWQWPSDRSQSNVENAHRPNGPMHATPVMKTDNTSSKAMSEPTIKPDIQPLTNNDLLLSLALRWQLDDVIYAFQQNQQSIEQQLTALADQLQLSKLATQALFNLFYRYQDYTKALANLKLDSPDITVDIPHETAIEFIDSAHQLQFTYFDQVEIDAFFGQSNQYDQQALERLAIRQDPTLTETQRQSLISNQIQQLSPEDRQVLAPTVQADQIMKYIEGETQQLDRLDSDALARVQTLKIEIQQWQKKVGDYLELKMKLESGVVAQDEIDRYVDEHFTLNEKRRLTVYVQNPQLLTQ